MNDALHRWIRDRLPVGALFLDLHMFPAGEIEVSVLNGIIRDFGPAYGVQSLSRIERANLDALRSTLHLEVDRYRGLFYVATDPPQAKIRVRVRLRSSDATGEKVVTLIGAMQLPLDILGKDIDLQAEARLWTADHPPEIRTGASPRIGFWWQDASAKNRKADPKAISEFGRVLREWGYIR